MERILDMINAECDKLCSRDIASSFKSSYDSAEDLKKFNFDILHSDLQRIAPTVWSIICTVATPTGIYGSRPDCHHPIECVVLAAAIVLRECCIHMTFHSHLAEQSRCKTANVAGSVNEVLMNFDTIHRTRCRSKVREILSSSAALDSQ